MKFRVFTLMALIAAALHVSAFAVDTELGGVYSGFIKKDKSPYIVNETLVIPEGKTVLVEAGVVLKFKPGTGIDVRGGSLAVVGESNKQVLFTPANESEHWNGVSITGVKRSEIQYLRLENADYGFAVESGALELRDVVISGAELAAVFVRNGSVDMQWGSIQNSKHIGVWATQSAQVNLDGLTLSGNHIALVATDASVVELQRTKLQNNDVAVLDFGDNNLAQKNSLIERNKIGIVSNDLPSEEMKRALNSNQQDVYRDVESLSQTLGEEPRNPYADGMKLYSMFQDAREDNSWKISGNVGLSLGYHKVLTRRNETGIPYISGNDTIMPGDHYRNYFQVPGLFANWNVGLMMESPTGQTIEFNADVSNDSWDNFRVRSLQAIYTDQMQNLTLGDFYLNAGETYLAGINGFGGLYELKLFKNAANEPLFVGTLFGGETRAPKIEGKRNFDAYNEYIGDGDAEAQNIVAGGRIRWNMHRRFNGTLGFIGSKDYLDDPILRDGQPATVNTSTPVMSSQTFFADGNWLFFPGDIKLNGQVAFGTADTVNAEKMRAINQVFASAGVSVANYSLLNKLMKDPHEVNRLSPEQLESIFGENSMMTPSEMRESLRNLLQKAADVAKESHKESLRPSSGDFWDYNHMALAGSYQWSNRTTFIEGYLRYVGREYYSAGSSDMLQNSRKVGGNFRQRFKDFWIFSFGYEMNVENAAGDSTGENVFGMAEGSQWGMFSCAEKDWLKEHEQDEVRTHYIHDAYVGNVFKLGKNVDLSVRYMVNYRTRSTPLRLYANYSVSSGIYEDDWFKARDGYSTIDVFDRGDTLKLDSARWARYYALSDEEYLATQFDEKLLRHILQLNLTFRLPKNVLQVGGQLMVRNDYSEFVQDDLLKGFDFSDDTYGILGYRFHGSDFIEQRYPITLTTTLGAFRNMFSVTPRYKIFNRYDMREFEWMVNENMSIPFAENFLVLSLNGGARQDFLNYEVRGRKMDEMELDVNGSASLRVNHTSDLYSEWTLGVEANYRPDSKADQYKDMFIIATLNYSF